MNLPEGYIERLRTLGECRIEEIGPRTSFGIGGKAVCFYPSSIVALKNALEILAQRPYAVMGGLSNVLCADGEMKTTLVFLRGGDFEHMTKEGDLWYLGAGLKVSHLLHRCLDLGLGGFEFAVGLPACVGGLTRMNATFRGEGIETVLAGAVVLTPSGDVKTLLGDELDISYRHSGLEDLVILGIYARLVARDPAEARARMKENVAFRKSKQAWGDRSAGCVFKNPSPQQPAGLLIDRSGLKGLRCGGAVVSEKHANFVVNKGGATAADVETLIVLIKRKVQEVTGVLLEEEVIRIP
jgi:UDP-N-acetylmuramate dehydrogenase